MSDKKINNRKDILLLLLYSPGISDKVNEEPIRGRTRIVKMLFLFQEEALAHFRRETNINEENFYKFFAWNFGPFSRDIYDDLTFFILRGFITSNETDEEGLPESAAEWEDWITSSGLESEIDEIREYVEEEFFLTKKGAEFTKELYETLSNSQKRLLKEFKARTSTVPLRALLRYVYEKYPEMTEKSQIRESLIGN